VLLDGNADCGGVFGDGKSRKACGGAGLGYGGEGDSPVESGDGCGALSGEQRALRALEVESRSATALEQATLARWASWGAVPEVFDEYTDWLVGLLTARGMTRWSTSPPMAPTRRRLWRR